jgi:exonuclease III
MPSSHPRRHLRTVAGVLAALSLAAPLALSSPGAQAADSVTVEVGSYNIIAGASTGDVRSAIGAVLPKVDVLGLQEINGMDKERVIAGFGDAGWGYFRQQPASQSPVMWRRSRFELVHARTEKISDERWIGNERPRTDPLLPSKHVSVVRLLDRVTGRKLSMINVHLVAGAVRGGQARPDRPRLYELYTDQVRNLAALADREDEWGRAFVLGDFNISWKIDAQKRLTPLVFASFKRIAMRSMWATGHPAEGGTRLDALLDQVYSKKSAARTSVLFDVRYSDHRPAVATYKFFMR